MKNKKAYIRILEAGLAAIILLGFIFVVTLPTYVKKTSFEDEVYKTLNSVLDEVERNATLRSYVLQDDEARLYSFVRVRFGEKQLAGNISVCGIQELCRPSGLPEKDIFVRERIIAGGAQNVKKASLYAWTRF